MESEKCKLQLHRGFGSKTRKLAIAHSPLPWPLPIPTSRLSKLTNCITFVSLFLDDYDWWFSVLVFSLLFSNIFLYYYYTIKTKLGLQGGVLIGNLLLSYQWVKLRVGGVSFHVLQMGRDELSAILISRFFSINVFFN